MTISEEQLREMEYDKLRIEKYLLFKQVQDKHGHTNRDKAEVMAIKKLCLKGLDYDGELDLVNKISDLESQLKETTEELYKVKAEYENLTELINKANKEIEGKRKELEATKKEADRMVSLVDGFKKNVR